MRCTLICDQLSHNYWIYFAWLRVFQCILCTNKWTSAANETDQQLRQLSCTQMRIFCGISVWHLPCGCAHSWVGLLVVATLLQSLVRALLPLKWWNRIVIWWLAARYKRHRFCARMFVAFGLSVEYIGLAENVCRSLKLVSGCRPKNEHTVAVWYRTLFCAIKLLINIMWPTYVYVNNVCANHFTAQVRQFVFELYD